MIFFSCLARAEEAPYKYEVHQQGDGTPVCTMKHKGAATKEQFLRIEVVVPAGSTLDSASLVKQATRAEVVPFPPDGISQPVGNGDLAVLTLEREEFGKLETALLQVQVNTAGAVSPPIGCKTAEGDSVSYFGEEDASQTHSIDGSALQYWLAAGKERQRTLLAQLKKIGGKKPTLLVHLPSGAVAPPMGNAVSEGALIQVAFLLPVNEERVPRITSKSCEAVNTFRQKAGEEADASAKQARPFSKKERKEFLANPKFKLVPVGQMFRCGAGTLSYEVRVPAR